jgi:hypothetical protein
VLYTSINTTQSPKTATDFDAPKVGYASTQTQHLLHLSIDKKHFFLHVKFEVEFVVSLTRNNLPNERHVSLFMVHASFKRRRLKNRQLFGFLNWRMPGTNGACVGDNAK